LGRPVTLPQGQDMQEELNQVRRGGNYGWRKYEGAWAAFTRRGKRTADARICRHTPKPCLRGRSGA
jgi:glucose/arabinose dehydrogenase